MANLLKGKLWKSFVLPRRASKGLQKPTKSVDILLREWPAYCDGYELLEHIGAGGHAEVYRARCKPLDSIVAVKKLLLDCPGQECDLEAVVREVTLMRRFNHPALLPLHACFVHGRELWVVTPYMGQGSIRSIMLRQFPEGLQEVVIASIMKFVLLGLQYVHKNGGIHRDVKADNILISEAGHVCLGDFGVAAALQLGSTADAPHHNFAGPCALRANTCVGTPCWMAPEVLKQVDGGYDAEADIWSFGITLIELALGKPPLARLPPMRVVLQTINDPPPSLDDNPLGRKFSKAFKEVVNACLHKEPSERPTAAALLKYSFFKQAKGSAFLAKHFLSAVPLPGARARVKQGLKGMMNPALRSSLAGSGRKLSMWLFPTPSHLERQESPELGLCDENQHQQQQKQSDADTQSPLAGTQVLSGTFSVQAVCRQCAGSVQAVCRHAGTFSVGL